jgi:hypothetical protein
MSNDAVGTSNAKRLALSGDISTDISTHHGRRVRLLPRCSEHGLTSPFPPVLLMPPALARILARSVCRLPAAACRNYSTEWRRFKDAAKRTVLRDQVREALRGDGEPTDVATHPGSASATHSTKIASDVAVHLAHHERLAGEKGIYTVWNSLRRQHYTLPTEDTPDAAFLWGTFIRHHLLVLHVVDHAAELVQRTGATYPRLYELILAHWLPRSPTTALHYHRSFLEKVQPQRLPLRNLARSGQTTFTAAAYEALMTMYTDSSERDLYDDIVPALVEKGGITMARRWHALCTERGDMPSESVAAQPVIRLFTTTATVSVPRSRLNQDLLRRLSGPDTAPVRFEDSFVARMFATRSFPPASIIQGLAMVGVNEIGPQAVLTMAAQTPQIEEVPQRFQELRAAGIALQGCIFSLALEKFALEQKWNLVRSMMQSDQHPDVFGDADVQRKLLEYYLDREDHVQVQRTLAILTLFHKDSSEESWNLLLQLHVKRTGPQHVMEVLQDMRARGVILTSESILAIKGLLRRRQQGHKPVSTTKGDRFDDVRFVTRVFTMVLEAGIAVIPPDQWREIIRRFGMLGRFRELRRLLLWLLCWYAPRSFQFAFLPKSPYLDAAVKRLRAAYPESKNYFNFPKTVLQRENPLHPIRQLLPPALLQALIIWGFKAGILPSAHLEQHLLNSPFAKNHYRRRLLQRRIVTRLQWSVGLRTVVQLRDLGVHVHYHTVVKALQMQFIVMFGRGRSRKIENRIVEMTNILPYARYVQEANKIWGSPLLREPQLFGKGMLHDHMWHPRLRRKIDRKAEISLGEVLGSNWQDRGSDDDAQQGDRVVEKEQAAALEELQEHFATQAKMMEPGFEFLGSSESVSNKRNITSK